MRKKFLYSGSLPNPVKIRLSGERMWRSTHYLKWVIVRECVRLLAAPLAAADRGERFAEVTKTKIY